MSERVQNQSQRTSPASFKPGSGGVLQRRCACGNHTMAGGHCKECSKNKRLGLQAKLKVNEPGDAYEQEADRIADQVMGKPAHSAVSGVPPRIQRYMGQSNEQTEAAPASVDQVLASPGRPLEPALRLDMEQRFGHDFSRVRVHTGGAAEQSARDVNAHAYTVGQDIAFGSGKFAPETHQGRRLLAHELTHVVQQTGADANVVHRSNGDNPLEELFEPRGSVYLSGAREPIRTNFWSGEIVTQRPSGPTSGGGGGATSWLEREGTQITRAESVALKLGSLLEAALPGPLDVLFLWVDFFGSIAEAQAKLGEESYLLGFCEGMAANLLGMGAPWVHKHLIERMPANPPEVSVGGFKAARVGGNNQGVVAGYRFVQRLTYKQREAFLKQGFAMVMAKGGPTAMNPDNFNLDDVITLGLALKPTVEKLLDVARRQALKRKAAQLFGFGR